MKSVVQEDKKNLFLEKKNNRVVLINILFGCLSFYVVVKASFSVSPCKSLRGPLCKISMISKKFEAKHRERKITSRVNIYKTVAIKRFFGEKLDLELP